MSRSSSPPLVVGIDGGGTKTRCVVADDQGNVIAEATGMGTNPYSGGSPQESLAGIIEQIRFQLGARTDFVRGAVVGLSGAESDFATTNQWVQALWAEVSFPGPVTLCSDPVVAFWSGYANFSPLEEEVTTGVVLIAGTGAIAARVDQTQVLARTDGYGYLVGDRGAGVWLGRKAVEAALDGASGRGPQTLLTNTIMGSKSVEEVLREVYRLPPTSLGRFAPVVTKLAQMGDLIARNICDQAAHELWMTLSSLLHAGEADCASNMGVTLVGSVATGNNVVASRLKEKLQQEGIKYRQGNDGIEGAIFLAKKMYLTK